MQLKYSSHFSNFINLEVLLLPRSQKAMKSTTSGASVVNAGRISALETTCGCLEILFIFFIIQYILLALNSQGIISMICFVVMIYLTLDRSLVLRRHERAHRGKHILM